jgi:hypothetical protein
MCKNSKSTKASKPTGEQIAMSKTVLLAWAKHRGEITPDGFRAINRAVRRLKQAYSK